MVFVGERRRAQRMRDATGAGRRAPRIDLEHLREPELSLVDLVGSDLVRAESALDENLMASLRTSTVRQSAQEENKVVELSIAKGSGIRNRDQ